MKEKLPKPSQFVELVLGEKAYPKQAEIMDAALDYAQVAVAAANAVGKTWAAARVATWFFLYFPNALVVTTAPTYRQVRYLLWREIRSVVARLKQRGVKDVGKPTYTTWSWKDRLALGFSAAEWSPDRFQGLHAEHLLVIVDEASGVADSIYEQIFSTLKGAHAVLYMIGNPLVRRGFFFQAFNSDSFKTFKLTAFDSPNVIERRVVIPGLVTIEDIERDRALFGEDSVYWKTRILAEFPPADSDSLFTLEDLDQAKELEPPENLELFPKEAGLDPARGGQSLTVLIVRQGPWAYLLETFDFNDLMKVARTVHELLLREGVSSIKVDVSGLGAGVADRLKELSNGHYEVVSFMATKASEKGFANLRTEVWMHLAELVKTKRAFGPVFSDRRVVHSLLDCTFEFSPQGKLRLKGKRGDVADFGDALTYAFYEPRQRVQLSQIEPLDPALMLVPRFDRRFPEPKRPWSAFT